MSVLVVPEMEPEGQEWPSLGPQVCSWIEANLVFGPGDLRGQPARLDPEKRALIHRMYEVYPRTHERAGRRRYKRVALSLRKGSAKTELAAWIAAAELHPRAPVRCATWDSRHCLVHGKVRAHGGEGVCRCVPIGGGVRDPFIPIVAYTEEQSEELCYGALRVILDNSKVAKDFDIGLERVMRKNGDGKALPVSTAPGPRDGARTTFQIADEALALDTPIPTPNGWTTMGDLQPGAFVLGSSGAAVEVMGCSPIHTSRRCFRVGFRDGTSIVCDADHLWAVRDRSRRGRDRTRWGVARTGEIAAAGLHYQNSGSPMWRWAVPIQRPMVSAEAPLPANPYLLGVWLGDGDRRAGCLTSHISDVPHWREVLPPFRLLAGKGETVRFIPRGLRSALRRAGLLGRKHIPAIYMRASAEQRLALLQGLFDTDGHVSTRGFATFSQTDTALTLQVTELLRLSGYRPRATRIRDSRSRSGGYWKVTAHARPDVPLFRMERKAGRVSRLTPRRVAEELAIVSVAPVESIPVRCIAVDAPDCLYQAGEGMILTHNTHRFILPRLRKAWDTMLANQPKRKLSDAWSLETTTAYCPGENSVAEKTMHYAQLVADGRVKDSLLFFFHRQAGDVDRETGKPYDLTEPAAVRRAVLEASGPVAEWSDLDSIVGQWADPSQDKAFLERVWLNRIVRSADRAFDIETWKKLAVPGHRPPKGATIALGFDGARQHDATGLVGCEVETGILFKVGCWEQDPLDPKWQVPQDEVCEAVDAAFAEWKVWRFYCDPPYWETVVADWAGKYGAEVVVFFLTRQVRKMADACRGFANAQADGSLRHDGDATFARHIGNSHKKLLTMRDDKGEQLWVIQKSRPESPDKIDLAVAGVLAWQSGQDARKAGVAAPKKRSVYATRGIVTI